MAVDVVLEHVLLLNLRHAPLTRTELARRTSASERTVQAALDELVGDTYVVRRPQQGMPAEYELSAAGSMRLKVVAELAESPS
ncbi:hypothetical protein, partial [Kribbella sp.]|uniref:hypothetical protein n=1 Tax=Kribbella sp. TaxID=1871183 RepID=UPI002D671671